MHQIPNNPRKELKMKDITNRIVELVKENNLSYKEAIEVLYEVRQYLENTIISFHSLK